MANAITAQGTTIAIGNGDSPLTYTAIGEVVSFAGLDGSASEVDITNLSSSAKEVLMGLQDFGNFTIELSFDANDAGQLLLRSAKASATIQDFRVTLSDTNTITFQGYVLSYTVSGSVDAKVDTSVAIRVSGAATFTASA